MSQPMWRKILLIGAMILVGWGGLFFGGRWLAGKVATELPYDVDRDLGAAMRDSLLQGETVCTNPELTGAVNEVLVALSSEVDPERLPLEVHVIDDDIVNAFALPGGYMVIPTGLLGAIEAPEELIGVLGHEIGHVVKRHSIRRIAQTLWFNILLAMVTDGSGMGDLFVGQAASLVNLGFDREQEREADVFGLALMREVGYAPGRFPDFFSRLPDHGVPELLSTHPDPAGRAEELRAEIAALPAIDPERPPPALERLRAPCHAPAADLPAERVQ